jgi:hypothetical protein
VLVEELLEIIMGLTKQALLVVVELVKTGWGELAEMDLQTLEEVEVVLVIMARLAEPVAQV